VTAPESSKHGWICETGLKLPAPADGSLWAAYEVQPAVLMLGALSGFAG
jgi:hypothetical protein